MKILIDLLQELQLDYAVATLEYDRVIANRQRVIGCRGSEYRLYRPSSDVEQAGEIIDREQITVLMLGDLCEATCPTGKPSSAVDRNPLRAAMLAYVKSRLGKAVKIPKHLA
jgi:hypothetical protein